MARKIHANASTTIADRRYIQGSSKSIRCLSDELEVSEVTIRKWRGRNFVEDKSHVANNLNTTLNDDEETIVIFLRLHLGLSIDELLAVVKFFVNDRVSRSALGRLIKRKNLKNEKKLTYINHASSNIVSCQSFENNVKKIIMLPFDKCLENIEGVLLISDARKKSIGIYAVTENYSMAMASAILHYCQRYESRLVLISEASAMKNELAAVCNQLCQNARFDCGVHCEQKLTPEFIIKTGKIVEQQLIILQQSRGASMGKILNYVQKTYNAINC